jgi:hypothetical protein
MLLRRALVIAIRKSGVPGLLLANVGIFAGLHRSKTMRYGNSGFGETLFGVGDGLCLGMIAICR